MCYEWAPMHYFIPHAYVLLHTLQQTPTANTLYNVGEEAECCNALLLLYTEWGERMTPLLLHTPSCYNHQFKFLDQTTMRILLLYYHRLISTFVYFSLPTVVFINVSCSAALIVSSAEHRTKILKKMIIVV